MHLGSLIPLLLVSTFLAAIPNSISVQKSGVARHRLIAIIAKPAVFFLGGVTHGSLSGAASLIDSNIHPLFFAPTCQSKSGNSHGKALFCLDSGDAFGIVDDPVIPPNHSPLSLLPNLSSLAIPRNIWCVAG